MDLSQLISLLPTLLKWGPIVGTFFLILFYGSLARRGLPKLSFAYRLLLRVILGAIVFFAALGLGQFVPLNLDISALILAPIQNLAAGVALALSIALGFYLFFYTMTHEKPHKEGKQDVKRIVGGVLLVLVIGVVAVGVTVPKPEEATLQVPVLGDLFKKEDPACLGVRTVMGSMSAEEIFGGQVRLYEDTKNIEFLLEDYPGHTFKEVFALKEGDEDYLLVPIIPNEYAGEGAEGPEAFTNLKMCTVRLRDFEKCDCTGFMGIADIFLKLTQEGGVMGEGVGVGNFG